MVYLKEEIKCVSHRYLEYTVNYIVEQTKIVSGLFVVSLTIVYSRDITAKSCTIAFQFLSGGWWLLILKCTYVDSRTEWHISKSSGYERCKWYFLCK